MMDRLRKPPKKSRWKVRYTVLILCWLVMLFSFLDRMIMTVALPFIGYEFNLSAGNQGLIISFFLWDTLYFKFLLVGY